MKIKSHGNLYLSFSFISVIVFETSGVFREKGKEMGLNACCQMPNIQPTRSMGKEQKKSIKTIIWLYRSLLDTLLFFKAKIWSAGEERTCRATELSASPCPPASAACAYSHSGVMLIDKVFGILAPVAHSPQPEREFCGNTRVAVSILLLPDV